ncbi:cytochrome ubiquinol oxidase subunit I [Numidum massiliense]|uniref:cytochrome ubiquinol oxidase subunit I n=1 Tax=Numidum massiliense TaxID=1522315 RepID=UPI0006D58727|nr:cytochrome ubiquinol oxidase subunit I [Numidum massiliense]
MFSLFSSGTFDNVTLARALTETTLAFHIIFAVLGVGVPLFVSLAEWIGIRRNDPHYVLMARRWSRGFTITVAVGVVTGTAIGLQLSLLWPSFMRVAGQAIALPLFMETFAFFIEAIFLGIYLYTWDRFKRPLYHWLLSLPVVFGSLASAVFITSVNAFMNTPTGFDLVDGQIVNVRPLAAMFNPATPSKVSHFLFAIYVTTAFILAAIAALAMLRGRVHIYYRKALKLTMVCAFVFALFTIVNGDLSGKFLAKHQPEKLAAAEWHFETRRQAPLVFGGFLDKETQEVKGAITIPYALSILAGTHPNTEVVGLNDFPRDEWPPLYVHYLFDSKVVNGFYLIVVSGVFVGWYLRKVRKRRKVTRRDQATDRDLGARDASLDEADIRRAPAVPKWLLWAIAVGGPLAMLTIELGWIFAEVGRQPWVLRGIMRTGEGATTADNVGTVFLAFVLLYLVLGIITVVILRRMFKNNPAEKELSERAERGKIREEEQWR